MDAFYVTPTMPNYKLRLLVGEKKVLIQFVNCQYRTEDAAIAAALDEMLASNPRVGRTVKKVDKSVGEKLAMEHRARQHQAGIRGPVNSMSLNHLRGGSAEAENLKLQQMGADPESAASVAVVLTGGNSVGVGVDSNVAKVAEPAKAGPLPLK